VVAEHAGHRGRVCPVVIFAEGYVLPSIAPLGQTMRQCLNFRPCQSSRDRRILGR